MLMLRWITPKPPCCARAMASRDSVTVSMAELTMGMFREIRRVRRVAVLACAGRTEEREGTSKTSSKVNASGRCLSTMLYYNRNSRAAVDTLRQVTDGQLQFIPIGLESARSLVTNFSMPKHHAATAAI